MTWCILIHIEIYVHVHWQTSSKCIHIFEHLDATNQLISSKQIALLRSPGFDQKMNLLFVWKQNSLVCGLFLRQISSHRHLNQSSTWPRNQHERNPIQFNSLIEKLIRICELVFLIVNLQVFFDYRFTVALFLLLLLLFCVFFVFRCQISTKVETWVRHFKRLQNCINAFTLF